MSCGTCGIQASDTLQGDTGVPAGAPTTANRPRCPHCKAFVAQEGAACHNPRCPGHQADQESPALAVRTRQGRTAAPPVVAAAGYERRPALPVPQAFYPLHPRSTPKEVAVTLGAALPGATGLPFVARLVGDAPDQALEIAPWPFGFSRREQCALAHYGLPRQENERQPYRLDLAAGRALVERLQTDMRAHQFMYEVPCRPYPAYVTEAEVPADTPPEMAEALLRNGVATVGKLLAGTVQGSGGTMLRFGASNRRGRELAGGIVVPLEVGIELAHQFHRTALRPNQPFEITVPVPAPLQEASFAGATLRNGDCDVAALRLRSAGNEQVAVLEVITPAQRVATGHIAAPVAVWQQLTADIRRQAQGTPASEGVNSWSVAQVDPTQDPAPAADAPPRLLTALDQQDYRQVQETIRDLQHYPLDVAGPLLVQTMLEIGDSEVQEAAVAALGQYDEGDRTLPYLEAALWCPSLHGRGAAIGFIGARASPAAVVLLGQVLSDTSRPGSTDNTVMRQAALAQLTAIAGDVVVPHVAAALQDEAPRIRQAAVDFLAATPGRTTTAALRTALDDTDAYVRGTAARALVQRGEAGLSPAPEVNR